MSLINKDFRSHESHSDKLQHNKLRWVLFAIASVTIGVVIANTKPFQQTIEAPLTAQIKTLPAFSDNNKISDASIKNTPEKPPSTATLKPDTDITKSDLAGSENTSSDTNHQSRKQFSLSLPKLPTKQTQIQQTPSPQSSLGQLNETASSQWQTFKIKSGDSIARIFKRAGISAAQVDALMKSGTVVKKLRKIRPRDILRLQTDTKGKLQALRYDINKKAYLSVERKNNKLVAQIVNRKIEVRTTHASGEINSSLYLAAKKAGISQNLVMKMAGVFGWDIDFARDIRKGDQFTLLYEELYRNGEKISDGNILAAEFINHGKTYRAVRYTNPQTNRSEYYSPDGKNMRKAFLRTPVKYSHVSSPFSVHRWHPILHKFRSHKGVDYAAKIGTPIYAAGDGKVIFKGREGGYGRVIILKHGRKYTTIYAHLNSYNRKIRKGSKVKQGQTIAYVGMSGLATGPHLHYEFRINGVAKNPVTVRLPEARPVPKRYLADFESKITPQLAQLDSLSRHQQIAYADTKKHLISNNN